MAVVRWEPFRELGALQNEMNRLFNTVFDAPAPGNGGQARRWVPAMDLLQTDEHFVLRADLPRMPGEDGSIELEDKAPTVLAERKAEHEDREGGNSPLACA